MEPQAKGQGPHQPVAPDMTGKQPQPRLSGSREAMEPLYEKLLKQSFSDSASAVEFCRNLCAEFGFTVKQEASANKHIYVYCSREGLPDSVRNPKRSPPQRKRPSKRCDCRWRVVLSENKNSRWEFRRFVNPNASEHNHEMMSPDELIKNWPPQVNDVIIDLARQRLQTHEIRDKVKQQFPDISWNERRFYNRLTEERKKMRQEAVLERTRHILQVSSQLCSVVAANEDWSNHVHTELTRMFEHFCQQAGIDRQSLLLDLDIESIASDVDSVKQSVSDSGGEDEPSLKRRKSIKGISTGLQTQQQSLKGVQSVFVPGYTIHVRTQPLRIEGSSSRRSSTATPSMPSFASQSPRSFASYPFQQPSSFPADTDMMYMPGGAPWSFPTAAAAAAAATATTPNSAVPPSSALSLQPPTIQHVSPQQQAMLPTFTPDVSFQPQQQQKHQPCMGSIGERPIPAPYNKKFQYKPNPVYMPFQNDRLQQHQQRTFQFQQQTPPPPPSQQQQQQQQQPYPHPSSFVPQQQQQHQMQGAVLTFANVNNMAMNGPNNSSNNNNNGASSGNSLLGAPIGTVQPGPWQ